MTVFLAWLGSGRSGYQACWGWHRVIGSCQQGLLFLGAGCEGVGACSRMQSAPVAGLLTRLIAVGCRCGPCRMIAPIVDEIAVEYGSKLRVVSNFATGRKPGCR